MDDLRRRYAPRKAWQTRVGIRSRILWLREERAIGDSVRLLDRAERRRKVAAEIWEADRAHHGETSWIARLLLAVRLARTVHWQLGPYIELKVETLSSLPPNVAWKKRKGTYTCTGIPSNSPLPSGSSSMARDAHVFTAITRCETGDSRSVDAIQLRSSSRFSQTLTTSPWLRVSISSSEWRERISWARMESWESRSECEP